MRSIPELNPFIYGQPLRPGEGIQRPAETEALLRLALSGQNSRLSAPRRYGKTTLLEEVREEAEKLGLNTVRVDLYGVRSREEVAVRLERAYRRLRGPMARLIGATLGRTGLKLSAGVGGATVGAETAPKPDIDARLVELLDLPVKFYKRTAAKTLFVYDEFQDVLHVGDGMDGVMRSCIQHHGDAATYIFAGSHPGMLAELFGDRSRPLYDLARAIQLEPLPPLAVAEYVEHRFAQSGRQAGRALDALVDTAQGHPQRSMLLAHHLWEQTPRGQRADEQTWDAASLAAYAELQDSFESTWSRHNDDEDRRVIRTVAAPRPRRLDLPSLERSGVSLEAAKRLLAAGHLHRLVDETLLVVDPLYAAWVFAGNRRPQLGHPRFVSSTGETEPSPFGAPDAGQATFGALGQASVAVDGRTAERSDLGVRIFVGRKGAGKTLALRRLSITAAQENSIYAADLEREAPLNAAVVRVCHQHDPGTWDTELWPAIWRAAILRSAVSHMATSRRLRDYAPLALDLLVRDFGDLVRAFRRPVTTASQVNEILAAHPSAQQLDRYLFHYAWEELAVAVGEVLRDLPPMFFFIDGLDEQSVSAPAEWLACQKGAFYAVTRMMRDPLGGRLHVCIAVRDGVYSSALGDEHASRFVGSREIRILSWDRERARHLLDAKLAALDERYLLRPDLGRTVLGWLGDVRGQDVGASTTTDLSDYLLSHTRDLPRDVVHLGNRLCRLTRILRAEGIDSVPAPRLRGLLAALSRQVGAEQLSICATRLLAERRPDAGESPLELYGGRGTPDMHAEAVERLRAALHGLRRRRFERAALLPVSRALREGFQVRDPTAALWREGLIGYFADANEVEARFYSSVDEESLPIREAPAYALHPVVADALGL